MRSMYWLVAIPSIPVVGLALNLHPTIGNIITLITTPCVMVVVLHTMERFLCIE